MTLTQSEVIAAWTALNTDAKGQQKTYAFAQLPDVGKMCKVIRETCADAEGKFKSEDCEVTLDTDCKKLLKDSLDREWPAGAAESVISLREKLSA